MTDAINKQNLVEIMANAANITKTAAESALNEFLDTVIVTLKKGGKVTIPGFGSWETGQRSARKGRNPNTGEEINIPAAVVAKFKAGKKLKDEVNTSK